MAAVEAEEVCAAHLAVADIGGEALCDNGGPCGTCDAPTEDEYRHAVQYNIGDSCGGHSHEGGAAVAHGAEDGCGVVIVHGNGHPRHEDACVQLCVGVQVGGDLQQTEEQVQSPLGDEDSDACDPNAQPSGLSQNDPQTVQIPFAVFLAHADGEALGEALSDAEEHPVEPVHGAQGSQCGEAHAPPHDGHVHHGVQLLEDIAEHQGEGKGKQQLQWAAACHIQLLLIHGNTSAFTLYSTILHDSQYSVKATETLQFVHRMFKKRSFSACYQNSHQKISENDGKKRQRLRKKIVT